MQTIHALLSRIRWDEEFGKGRFEIAYLDHAEPELVRIPVDSLDFEAGNTFSFSFLGEQEEDHRIPFHRVREVYKDGERIWSRPLLRGK